MCALSDRRFDHCIKCLGVFFHELQACDRCGMPAPPSPRNISYDEWRLLQNELTSSLCPG